MYRGSNRHFKVVSRSEKQFGVWLADATLTDRWLETGISGTENACWDYVEEAESLTGFILNSYPDSGLF